MNVDIKIYPAKNGDCFLVSFGETAEEKKHLLVDCGYVDTFLNYLKNDLLEIDENGGTVNSAHVDPLFRDVDPPPVLFGNLKELFEVKIVFL